MDRRPSLIAPVIIMACAMIVVGGIMTVLSQTGGASATVTLPLLLPGNETAVPTTGTMPDAAGAGAATPAGTAPTGTGAGGAADGAALRENATAPSPTATAANGTACAATAGRAGPSNAAGTGTDAPAGTRERRAP